MTVPKVSVVITCYNYDQYIGDAVESVLAQTWQDFEIIVIDDGSTDNTRLVMDKYRDNKKICYTLQENQGASRARNRGLLESKGEFIAFLDADDMWLQDKLARQLELFKDQAVGVVYTRRYWINPIGRIVDGDERTLRRGNILDYIFIDNIVCFSSAMVRKHLVDAVGGFDETLPMGMDYDLWVRLAALCKFDYVDQPLVKYRTGHANLSSNTIKRYECAEKIMLKNLANPSISKKLDWWVIRYAWAETWKNKGNIFRRQGYYDSAIVLYKKAIINNPLLVSAWVGLAASCFLKIKK